MDLGSVIANDARCPREIKSSVTVVHVASNKKMSLFASKLDLSLKKKLVKLYVWSIALYVALN